MDALTLGPLALPWTRVQVALGLFAFLLAAGLVGRRVDPRLGAWASNAVLWGLVGARLGFVLENLAVYAKDPPSVLYLWQGGFDPWWGILVGGGYTLMTLPKGLLRPALFAALAGGVVFLLVFALSPGRRASSETLPPLTFSTLGGTPVNLQDFRGRPLVLNAWATWCPPCRRELPMMLRVAEETPGVRFAFVSQGEGPAAVRAFLEKEKLAGDWFLLDPETRLSEALKLQGLPTTFFFDREGRLVARHLGELSEALLRGYLRVISPP